MTNKQFILYAISIKAILAFLDIRRATTAKENTNDNKDFLPANNDKVKQCLLKLNPRKIIGQNKIPSVLIKMAAESLMSTSLSIAINKSINITFFLVMQS